MAGRPRSFDRDAALLISMEHFWRKGYERTTIGDLTQALGITAPSLYAAFGDKDALFAEAADRYADAVTAQLDKTLEQPTVREGIAELLDITTASYTDDDTPAGCFLLSEPRLLTHRRRLTRRLAERVSQGIEAGDLRAGTNPDSLADFIMAVIGGMSTRARDGGSAADVRAIADVAITAVDARSV